MVSSCATTPGDGTPGADHLVGPADVGPAGRVRHRGMFAHACCPECGWQGPARRALGSTGTDLRRHLAEAHTGEAAT